jgi:hypothetical protein
MRFLTSAKHVIACPLIIFGNVPRPRIKLARHDPRRFRFRVAVIALYSVIDNDPELQALSVDLLHGLIESCRSHYPGGLAEIA